jgi:hypothetical protein
MDSRKRSLTRFWFIAALLAALVTVLTAPAVSADDVGATGNLSGTFSDSTTGVLTFNVQIHGTVQDIAQSAGPTLTAADFRTTPGGWTITAAATQFHTGGGTPLLLGTNALKVTAISNGTCTAGVTCGTSPSNTVSYGTPITLTAVDSTTAGTPATIYTTTGGDGSFDITPTFHLAIAGADRAGTYTATVTIAYTAT